MTVWVLVALVAAVTAAAWASPVLARPTLPFGVRVPTAHAGDPAIAVTRRRYGQAVVACGVLAVAATLMLDAAPEAVLLVLLAADCLVGYLAHRAVAAAKRRGDWYAGARQGAVADTSFRTDPVRPQWSLLAPAAGLLAVTVAVGVIRYPTLPPTLPTPDGLIVDAGHRTATTVLYAFATVTAQLLIVLVVAVLAVAIPRARPELDAASPAASATRYRGYLRGVVRLLLISAGCANASLLVASLQVWEILDTGPLVTATSYAPLATALVAWVIFAVRAGDAGHRLPAEESPGRPGLQQRDDDRHWHLAGMVYVNRRDPAILVHRRVGAFWTLNLGHPVSWVIAAAVAAVAVLSGLDVIELPERGG